MAQGIGTDRPVSPLDREQIAKLEVGQTAIAPSLARVVVVVFVATISMLPIVELALSGAPGAGSDAPGGPAVSAVPGTSGAFGAWAAWQRVVAVNREMLARMSAFETALEDQSVIGQALRPPTQAVLSGLFGAGNERVYVGNDGWLFYRPDVEYVTGRGFLDPREHERRVAAAPEYEVPPQPDPRRAIVEFHRDLTARGITLVVMPTPVKPTIHPEQLASGAPAAPLHNPSYTAFVDDLRREGVLVLDPAAAILAGGGGAHYLESDTHWRPETMQRVAEAVGAFVREHVPLPDAPPAGYTAQRREARQTGDTAAMLDLPEGQSLYPAARVSLRFIVNAEGEPWRSSRDADVLLLGDSFTNIYSLQSMGWGEAAGLAEQLSFVLQRPLDRLVQNDQGAYATRVMLARDPARLEGTRVVIWQFAARELAFGDWRLIDIPDVDALRP